MFTTRKQGPEEASSPGLYGFFRSGLSKVTGRGGRTSSSPQPSQGTATPGSPESPRADAQHCETCSPELDDFVSPRQDLATSQQGTPEDNARHGEHMSAVGLLQLGSVLAGAPEDAQHTQSITAHQHALPEDQVPVEMPAASQKALVPEFDPFSWPSQAAKAALEHPMPVKRSAHLADDIANFLTERQSKRQRLEAFSSGQSSTKQLALPHTEQSGLLQPPSYSSRPHAIRSSLALPLPSPEPVAPASLMFRRQGTSMPSRFATQRQAFARPVNPPPMFNGRPTPAGPFSMGTTRQDTPRPQHQRAAGSSLAPFRSGRSETAASMQGGNTPANSRFRFGGSTQQALPFSPQGVLPSSASQSQAFPSGSQHQLFRQAGTPQEQSLFSSAPSDRALVQQPGGQSNRQTPAVSSGPSSSSTVSRDSDLKAKHSRPSGNAWTPMKAPHDLPRQALVNKLMKGKELPKNSLLAAGLDPTMSGPTPRSARQFQRGQPSAQKRKANELEATDGDQAGVTEGHGRHKQAKVLEPQPAEPHLNSYQPAPPPVAVLGFAPAVSEQPHSPAPQPSTHTPDGRLAIGQASTAAQAQPKDYGAPWAVAAAENPPNAAAYTPAPANSLSVASPAVAAAAPHSSDQPTPGLNFAPSPNTVLPKGGSSLTDNLAHQRPSTPGSFSLPFVCAPPAAAPPPSPALLFSASPQPAAPASWNTTGIQPPAFQSALNSSSPQHQQLQAAAVHASTEQAAAPVLANGPSIHDGSKGQQAASVSSDGSGDTSVNLYPFPLQRSAQDRLEGIVSFGPCAQDDAGLYVFGRQGGALAENDRGITGATLLSMGQENGNHVASPSGPHQDAYLSPGQATRLHTLSSGVALPDSGSDDEHQAQAHATAPGDGPETAATPQEEQGASPTEGVQSTASEGGAVSDDDTGSSISGMSAVSSVAPTEVVTDEQHDDVGLGEPGTQTPSTVAWGGAFLQANMAVAQRATEAFEAATARKEAASETKTSEEEAARRQQPTGEAAQAGAASSPEPAEHHTAADAASEQQAAPAEAGPSVPKGNVPTQAAAAIQPRHGMHASSLMSTSRETEAAAEKAALPPSHLPWKSSQATWPARNAPNALLMQAIDAPLPDDPPLPFKDSAPPTGTPTQAAPPEEGTSDADRQQQPGGKKPRRVVRRKQKM